MIVPGMLVCSRILISMMGKVGLVGELFLTLTISFRLTMYTLQIRLYFVGNILV